MHKALHRSGFQNTRGTNLFPNHLGDTPNTKKNNNQEKILIFLIRTADPSAAAQRGRSFGKRRPLHDRTALRYRSNGVERNAGKRYKNPLVLEILCGLQHGRSSQNDGRLFPGVSLIRAAVRPLLHEEIEFSALLQASRKHLRLDAASTEKIDAPRPLDHTPRVLADDEAGKGDPG